MKKARHCGACSSFNYPRSLSILLSYSQIINQESTASVCSLLGSKEHALLRLGRQAFQEEAGRNSYHQAQDLPVWPISQFSPQLVVPTTQLCPTSFIKLLENVESRPTQLTLGYQPRHFEVKKARVVGWLDSWEKLWGGDKWGGIFGLTSFGHGQALLQGLGRRAKAANTKGQQSSTFPCLSRG